MAKYNLDANVITKMIASIVKRTAIIAKDTNTVAISALLHALEHGNTTPMNDLLKAFGKSQKSSSLKVWATTHGPFNVEKIDVDGKKVTTFAYDKAKAKAIKAIEGYTNDTYGDSLPDFLDNKAEPEFRPFDFNKALHALIERANKRKSEGNKEDNFEGLDKLVALLGN